MNRSVTDTQRSGERGNVLFLILIAVALFAALSYAVTQSSRSGGGDASNETNLISSAQITQYPASIRTAVIRMIIGGSGVDNLLFNSPSDFGAIAGDEAMSVYHPLGGGATYQLSSPDVMESASAGVWHFNANFEIDNVGTEVAGDPDGNDLIAFLPGIKEGICERINSELGINSVPLATADLSAAYTEDMDDSYDLSTVTANTYLGTIGANGTGALTGQPFGCFENSTNEYVYYHVIVER